MLAAGADHPSVTQSGHQDVYLTAVKLIWSCAPSGYKKTLEHTAKDVGVSSISGHQAPCYYYITAKSDQRAKLCWRQENSANDLKRPNPTVSLVCRVWHTLVESGYMEARCRRILTYGPLTALRQIYLDAQRK